MEKNNLQKKLFGIIKDISSLNISYIDELADLLNVSNDSIYRRLRGETDLTADEAALICQHYKISFDNLININNNSVSFSFKTIHSEEDFLEFFKRMSKDLKAISKSENPLITYAAFDIPLFHHFNYDLLAKFKLYSWMNSVLYLPAYVNKTFEPDIINKEMIDVCKNIWEEYKHIPSNEIWTENTINSTLKQLEFNWEAGKISDKEILIELISEFNSELKAIENMASLSSKLNKEQKTENYQLYFSETEIGNNCIQVNIGKENAVYLSHNTFNTLTTFNQVFNNETKIWLDNLIRKSEMISGISQKRRYQFFKKAHEKAEILLEKIN